LALPLRVTPWTFTALRDKPVKMGRVRRVSVGTKPAFVMLSEAKHLAHEGSLRFVSCAAPILR